MNDSFFPSSQEYSKRFGLNSLRLAKLSKNAIVMHPGPMNRGLEISAESADDLKSVIIDQVKNGVAIRMAVLYELLGGAPIGEGK
jgi:aspartate carbamoyltransferase catalytic subunit